MLNDLHKRLLNDFQRNFPLTSRPYLAIAEQLGVSEQTVLTAFAELQHQQMISRIGAVIPPNQLGVSSLVAMAVPAEQINEIAERINRYPEVNHNYEREHDWNLWFVVMASTHTELEEVISQIEQDTGYSALRLPLVRDFFIDLGFTLQWHDA